MLSLAAKTRQAKNKALRKKGVLPAVLYGPGLKNENLAVDLKEFEKVFQQAGESTLISLEVEGKKKYLVLVHDLERDPLKDVPIHIDFYQPDLKKKIQVKVPLVLEGEAPAVKNLAGTLVKNMAEVEVKALPQNLPKEIRVDVSGLVTFEDTIAVKDLQLSEGVEVLRDPQETIAHVAPPEKVEEELAKPVEEKVEEVEKVEKEKKEGEEEVAEPKEEKKEAKKEEPVQEKKEKKENG